MEGFLRPEPSVLLDNTVIPDSNHISPAPNQFTHVLTRAQPFYFNRGLQASRPDGEFPAGMKVVLLVYNGGEYCQVANDQGLYVEVEYESLRALDD